MSTESKARTRVAAAEQACDKALSSWRTAVAALGGNVSVNGFGIIHDRSAFKQKLYEAQAQISAGLAALDGVDWPTGTDYDEL